MERTLDFEVDSHESLNKMLTGVLMDVRRGNLDHSMVKSITLVADKINKNVQNANEYKKISNHNQPIKFFENDLKNRKND